MFSHRIIQEEIAEELITHLLGFKPGEQNFNRSLQYVCSNLYHHKCLSPEPKQLKRRVDGTLLKLSVLGHSSARAKLESLFDAWINNEDIEDTSKWSILSLLLDLSQSITEAPVTHKGKPKVVTSSSAAEDGIVQELLDERFMLHHLNEEELSDWSSDEETPNQQTVTNHTRISQAKIPIAHSAGDFNKVAAVPKGMPVYVLQREAAKAKQWLSVNASSPTVNSDGQREVTEEELVKEVLDAIICANGSVAVLTNPPSVSTISYSFVLSIIRRVQPLVEQLSALSSPFSGSESLVCRGYLAALHDYLGNTRQRVMTLIQHTKETSSPVTLVWLVQSLEQFFPTVSALSAVHSVCLQQCTDRVQQLRLLSTLSVSFNQSVTAEVRSLMLTCLLQSLCPLLQCLQEDDISDVPSVIYRNGDICTKSAEFLTHAYVNPNEAEEKTISKIEGIQSPLATIQIIGRAFKYREYLSALQENAPKSCAAGETFRTKVAPAMHSILSRLEELSSPDEVTTDDTADVVSGISKLSLPSTFTSHKLFSIVSQYCEQRANELADAAAEILYTNHSLGDHVMALTYASLVQPANVMRNFTASLFDRCSEGGRLEGAALTLELQESINTLVPGMGKLLHVTTASDSQDTTHCQEEWESFFEGLQMETQPLESRNMEDLKLHYQMQWPLSSVLPSWQSEVFNGVLQFSLRLQQSVHVLHSLSFSDIEGWGMTKTKRFEDSTPFPWKVHRLKLLRHWLLYFCYSIRQHFTSCVLLPFCLTIERLARGKPNVQHFVQEYTSELKNIRQQCLLANTGGESPVESAFKQVLTIVNKVASAWRRGGCSLEELTAMEASYAAYHRFLVKLLTALVKRNEVTHSHLSALMEALQSSSPVSV